MSAVASSDDEPDGASTVIDGCGGNARELEDAENCVSVSDVCMSAADADDCVSEVDDEEAAQLSAAASEAGSEMLC